jgi:hypothetical protein
MKKNYRNPIWILIILGLGGLAIIALTWLFYLGVYLTIETLFYAENPLEVPVSQIRLGTAIVLSMAGYLVMRSKMTALFKALLIMSPISIVLVTLIFRIYTNPIALWITVIGYTGALIAGIRLAKLPWYFYVSVVFSVLVSTIYAWPR